MCKKKDKELSQKEREERKRKRYEQTQKILEAQNKVNIIRATIGLIYALFAVGLLTWFVVILMNGVEDLTSAKAVQEVVINSLCQ